MPDANMSNGNHQNIYPGRYYQFMTRQCDACRALAVSGKGCFLADYRLNGTARFLTLHDKARADHQPGLNRFLRTT